jgi:phenylacetate-CoA ligase
VDITETIRRFLSSNTIIDRIAGQFFERLPLKLRYRAYYGRTFLHWLALLKESQYWEKEKHYAYQFEQLKQLLVHAYRNVFYYRKLFDDYRFAPGKVQSIEDINILPYLTKETVRDRREEFIANNIAQKDLLKETTSGSTGIPLTIYSTRESWEISEAFLCNLLDRIGYNAKRRIAFFSWRDIYSGKNELTHRKYGNKLIISPKTVAYDSIDQYYTMIRDFGPEYITGNKSVLLSFSSRLKESGLPPLSGLKAAFAYGETIYPWQRILVEESLGTRLFSSYGMTEGVIFGGECEHSQYYHIYPQKGISEFLDKHENRFEIAGTNFTNYAMPFIRYRTGDVSVKGSGRCDKCNRNFQLIDRIEGRLNEFLVNKKGKLLPTAMTRIYTDVFDNVKQFQFYQDEPGLAYLRIIRREAYSETDTHDIEETIARLFNIPQSGLEIKLVFVEAVTCAPSGKTLLTDQRLNMKEFIGEWRDSACPE